MEVWEKLRRTKMCLTQDHVAEKLAVTHQMISNWEDSRSYL